MRLTAKTLFITGGTLLGLLVVVYVVARLLVLDSFAELQDAEAMEETSRARTIVQVDLENLGSTNVDWSSWDDTYDFVNGEFPEFLDENISAGTLTNLGLSTMIYTDANGAVVFAAELDPDSGELVDLSSGWTEALEASGNDFRFDSLDAQADGFVDAGRPMLVAARPILHSDGSGPIAGAVIFGEVLDEDKLTAIGRVVGHEVSLEDIEDSAAQPVQQLSAENTSVLGSVDSELAGFAVIDGLDGQPGAALRVNLEELALYQQGQTTVAWMIAAIFLSGLIMSLVVVVLLQRFVLSRLSTMRLTLRAISNTSGTRDRLPDLGSDEIGEVGVTVNQFIDAVEKSDEALRAAESYWRSLIHNAQDAVAVIDSTGRIQYASPAVRHILGYEPDDLIGRLALEIIHEEDRERAMAGLANASQIDSGEGEPGEFRMMHRDGHWLHIEARGSLVQGEHGDFVVINAHDITERRKAEETIAHMAYHDSLTGLPNRLLLGDRLNVAIGGSRRTGLGVSVVAVDIDRFKNVNDLLGHSAGDELLRQVAARLQSMVRDGDTVARLGGDEFVVVLPDCRSYAEADDASRRIIEGFRKPFQIAHREIHVTVSAGVGIYPEHGTDGETLISNADVALYVAKDAGRNTFRRFSESMNTRSSEWFAVESQLRHAIDNDEIVVYYQPQLRVDTGEVIGAEALARWNHPTRGIVPPSEFISVAEETGLISALGEIVLRKACLEALTWPDVNGQQLRVAVNVSLRQFERPDFVQRILAVVHETELPSDRLELEVTESTALRDVEHTKAIAHALTESGIRLSIDDFGTGSTSLRHLQELPLHTVKIDQGFIRKLMENPANAAIAAGIIALSHNLNLNVIAEGVETQEQLEFLQGEHCDEFQGFLISKPIPGDDFRAMLKSTADAAAASDAADDRSRKAIA